jgi:hypothetical protein
VKNVVIIYLASFASLSYADSDCDISSKNLTFKTPKSNDIAKTFWQDDKDGYETIKRLHITYKDGSVAVLEHKFCSMYNFEVAYYATDKETVNNTDLIQKKAEYFFSYAAIQGGDQQEAVETMTKSLHDKKFDPEKEASIGYEGSHPQYGRAEYIIDYRPLGSASIHKAAITLYVGLGGMH